MGKNDLHLEEAASSLTMSQEHKVLYHTEVLPATRPQITFLLPGKGTPPSVTAAVRSASTDTPQCPHHSSGTLWHEDLGQTSRSKEKKKKQTIHAQVALSPEFVPALEIFSS